MSQNALTDIQKIENLLVGCGAQDFAKLKKITDVFCPFEAIGMVGQEIRHAHFLTYVIDPNRPHGFGAAFLQEFLRVCVQSDPVRGISALDLHLATLAEATIRREWQRIDLLIEVPKLAGKGKGVVFVVELKIDAGEGAGQLEKYEKIVARKFPAKHYDYQFIYLTKRGDDASRKKWCSVSLAEIVDGFMAVLEARKFTGLPAETMRAYLEMQRRHHLPNKELENLAYKIWAKHGDALDVLAKYRPDIRSFLENQLQKDSWMKETAKVLSDKTGLTIQQEVSTKKHRRFAIAKWGELDCMSAGTKKWLSSARLASIEVFLDKTHCYTKLVFGPDTNGHHEKMVDALSENFTKEEFVVNKRATPTKQWTIMSQKAVYKVEDAFDRRQKGVSGEELAAEITERVADYWSNLLPEYDRIIQEYSRAVDKTGETKQ